MSKSTPVNAIGTAFAVAVLAALAQLGLATGLAILIWRSGSAAEWAAQLSWGAFLAAVATIAGGLVAGRLITDTGPRITAVLASGIGAFTLAPLIAVPAMRFEDAPIATAPFAAVGIGVLAGLLLSGLALAWRAIKISVLATIALTWVLAILAAFVPVDDASRIVKVAVWGEWKGLSASAPIVPALLVGTLLIGMITAWVMTSPDAVGDHRITAISGAVGPLLLVAAYAAAGQDDVRVDPQWHGMGVGTGAVVAGLLGGLLVTALRRAPSPAPAVDTALTPTATATASVEPGSLGDPSEDDRTQTVPAMPRADQTYEVPAAPPPFPPPPAENLDPYVSAEYDEAQLTQYVDATAAAGHQAEVRGTEFDEPEPPPPPPAPEPEPQPEPAKKTAKKARKTAKPKPKPEPAPEPEAEQALFPPPEPESDPGKTKAMPAAKPDETDPDENWYSELRDENAFINDHNETPDSAPEPEAAPQKKRRWGRKKKED
ncbi:hypothetical protein [Stackebrandtia nassauensis]|uniref:Uncharacterized protein n=1 Tax=Stackebrandtia nassauensis (strain DSM 44728 / CIP 108903 / NRRL B-16338 / NBRC 102104 / LLR-40K-21) TaxID=446470 RepID=D3Q2Y2_STANL|nr:hypothetical protein [Stackebrandtia nassauensis]ADD39952.1 hypothetical protein Snas_0233 [Stackebrandtia nassauensis DSM 44728]